MDSYRAGARREDARLEGAVRIAKLASNENPLGASPRALAVLRSAGAEVSRYPDPGAARLTAMLAKRCQRHRTEILCGAGSDSLIAVAYATFSEAGEEVLTSAGSFIGAYLNAQKIGRTVRTVPLRDYHIDLDAIASALSSKTRIIYLANPNNPTGTMFAQSALEDFLGKVPEDVLVILDEAYAEYAQEFEEYPRGIALRRENLLVLRTFSKAHGLAGLRVGYAVGEESVISAMRKVRLPFEPGALGQAAAAASLEDTGFLERTLESNRLSLQMFRDAFLRWGIRQVVSAANFLMIVFPHESEALRFAQRCMEKGVLVRHLKAFGIPEGVRISSGTIDETHFALRIMEAALR